MCHHYVGAKDPPPWLELVPGFSERVTFTPWGLTNFYPLSQVPVVRLDNNGEREFIACQWGFLPFWWKPKDAKDKPTAFQRKCYNAVSEEIHTKRSYQAAFKSRRCLLVGAEFEEKRHMFSLPGKNAFCFAAIWEEWNDRSSLFPSSVVSCSMLTTEPNAEVRSVGHHRMPVLLRTEEEYAAWLNPEIVERGPLEELMRPLVDGVLQVAPAK